MITHIKMWMKHKTYVTNKGNNARRIENIHLKKQGRHTGEKSE